MTDILPTIQKRYTEDKRFYRITEQGLKEPMFIPSVTTILKSVKINSFLDNWKEEEAEKVGVLGSRLNLFLAAERGTNVHNAIEDYNLRHIQQDGEPIGWNIFTDTEWKCINRYHHWFHIRNPRVLSVESNVYSKKRWYAGQLDAVMEIQPPKKKKSDPDMQTGKYVVDFKTSKDIYDGSEEQVSAYMVAYEEMHNVKLDGCLILALRVQTQKGWKERYMTRDEALHKFEGFLLRKHVFEFYNPDFQPRRDLMPEEIYPLVSPEEIITP